LKNSDAAKKLITLHYTDRLSLRLRCRWTIRTRDKPVRTSQHVLLPVRRILKTSVDAGVLYATEPHDQTTANRVPARERQRNRRERERDIERDGRRRLLLSATDGIVFAFVERDCCWCWSSADRCPVVRTAHLTSSTVAAAAEEEEEEDERKRSPIGHADALACDHLRRSSDRRLIGLTRLSTRVASRYHCLSLPVLISHYGLGNMYMSVWMCVRVCICLSIYLCRQGIF